MLRVLAGAWFVLHERTWSDDGVAGFFELISPIMRAPLPDDSPWLADGREADFYRSASGQATSPNAHRGVDLHLTDALVGWATKPPHWMSGGDDSSPVNELAPGKKLHSIQQGPAMSRSSHVLCRRCRTRAAHRHTPHQLCGACWRQERAQRRRVEFSATGADVEIR
jgi:hypothetical protein